MNIKIASSNLNQIPLDWDKNYSNIKTSILESIKNNVKVLCLPELSITGYGCQDLFFTNWVIEKAKLELIKIQKLCNQITVIVGLPLHYKNKTYNTCCIINNKEIKSFFVKSNLPNDGIHYEKRWFDPWNLGEKKEIFFNGNKVPIGTIQYEYNKDLTIGFEICRDSWDKERPANFIKINKKHLLILNPIASHYAFKKFDFRKNQVIDSSKKYDCTYISCNLLGNESGKSIFEGDTILAQKGKLLHISKRFSFKNVISNIYDIDLEKTSTKFVDSKTNIFEEFINAASLALFDYNIKSKCNGFTVSLSGGADSSCTVILVYEMIRRAMLELGEKGVIKKLNLKNLQKDYYSINTIMKNILITVYQKSKNSSLATELSAKKLAQFISSTHFKWSINEEVKSIINKISKATNKKYNWENDNIALQNVQARVRSPFIWFIANTNNRILLSTSNRSESAVGYSTMDGDTSGSVSPIAGIDKVFIKKLLIYLKEKYNYNCLNNVLNLEPSAELKPKKFNQKDEDDLMPYSILSRIERYAIKERLSPKNIYDKIKKEKIYTDNKLKKYIKKFFNLLGKNQWKRERTAPSFHFDDYSLDASTWYRFPILSSNFKQEIEEL
ncbi:MAG: NAD(+) synthase [Marinoscillum sp.]